MIGFDLIIQYTEEGKKNVRSDVCVVASDTSVFPVYFYRAITQCEGNVNSYDLVVRTTFIPQKWLITEEEKNEPIPSDMRTVDRNKSTGRQVFFPLKWVGNIFFYNL